MKFKDSFFHTRENVNKKPLVITRPIFLGFNYYSIFFILWLFLRFIKVILFKSQFRNLLQSGHSAVFDSLKRGSKKRLDFNFWGKLPARQTVVVISSELAALQMNYFKKKGFIERLYLGPNIDWDFFKNSLPYTSGIIVPSLEASTGVKCVSYENYKKTFIWPAGVDTEYWKKTNTTKKNNNILIYYKEEKGPLMDKNTIKNKLSKLKLNIKFIEYGSYSFNEYKKQLDNVKFALFLSREETQGIAFFEAWSMNVFTYVWHYEVKSYKGLDYVGSPCPYLNQALGKYVNSFENLIQSIKNKEYCDKKVSPRKWVLKNATDEKTVTNLIKLIS